MGYGMKVTAVATFASVALGLATPSFSATRQVEYLNRGLSVGNTGNGVLVSWRLLASDAPNTGFNLYRDGTKVATIDATQGTNYLDAKGSVTAKYTVAPVVNGVEGAHAGASVVLGSTNSGHSYTTIKLDVPADQTMPDGSTCSYTPNDMSAGDLDGDGEMDLVLKWDPSNSKDNSQSGYTGSVIIDGLKLDGTRLWRIDLGKNIRAGAHYTQFMVYDLDGDGISEIVMKTSDGTVDGKGTVIGDKSKDYRTSTGTIMSGNEYLTVFNGKTGAAINTIDYWPKRDITNKWGDTYGNRSERMLAAVAYLDGVHPSVVFSRGYYTAAYVAAYNFDGKKLTQVWQHKSETSGQGLYGQGNHNLSVGDMDGDGYDEIVWGAGALKHDGTLLHRTGLGHGDAMHLSDLDPDLPGLELWDVHEEKSAKYTDEMHDQNGKIIWGDLQPDPGVDNGRGMAADIDSTSRGFEMWSGQSGGIRTCKGGKLNATTPSVNFRIYWDGDLQDELFDGTGSGKGGKIEKWNSSKKTIDRIFTPANVNNATVNNSTKSNPGLVADLFGDWREELIMRNANDASQLIVFSTGATSPYRLYTLLHDTHYRVSIAWQNVAYNQPPHVGYYLPDMVKNLKKPDVYYAKVPEGVQEVIPASSSSVDASSSSVVPTSSEVVTPAGFDYASVVNAANPDEGVGTYEKTNAGYIGDGYYNFNNEAGSSATWKLNVSKAGESQIAIRFANGGNANRDMTLVVNGKEVGTVVFPSTGAWTTYEVAVVDGAVALNAGANTVQLVSVSAEGGPNVDAFGFSLAGVAQGSSTESTTAQPKVVALNNSFDAISGTIRVAEAGIAEIYVYDVTGHMVTGLSKMVSAGESRIGLEKTGLSKGVYLVKVLFNGRLVSSSTMTHLR